MPDGGRLTMEERRARREAARRRIHRRRRIAALLLLGLVALLAVGVSSIAGALSGPSGTDGGERAAGNAAEAAVAAEPPKPPPPPPELPRGGRRIFPDHRVVGFYGAPQAEELGILGIGTPTRAGRRLREQAAEYRRGGRKILPAFELIATVAAGAPGEDGKYRYRQDRKTIRRYHKAARRAGALLVLDIQPGLEDFMTEVRALRPFLVEPDVGLALDPEWSMQPGQVPGQQIGRIEAETVNRISAYLNDIVRRRDLPQKLLIVHQFTDDMLQGKDRLKRRRGVALTINIDGFGGQEIKRQKYEAFASQSRRLHNGFKLFYKEDTNLMSPRQVLAMDPRPDLVMYE